jgi:ATP-dependent protease ClpP protease subunit
MLYNIFVLAFLIAPLFVLSSKEVVKTDKEIELNVDNSLFIRGEIDEKMATEFVFDVNKRKSKKNMYVFLDTNGGSVDAGNQIIYEIQKYNLSCIAHKAISMGFVILQSCNERYITPFGTLMQHQISYGIMDEKAKVESYVEYIKQIGDQLTELQANKIGITKKEFERRTYNDWWLFGKNAVKENCVDDLSKIMCTSQLTNSTYIVEKGSYTYTYSNCPLVTGPIEKKKNKQHTDLSDYLFG